MAWLIYGNTFHYSEAGFACMRMSSDTHQLWILMMMILCFGYILMLLYFLVILIAIVGGCIVLICCRDQLPQINQLFDSPIIEKLPYIDAIKGLKKKSFSKVRKEHRTMD
jgi:hypothetical protein